MKNIHSYCVKEAERKENTKPHQLPLYATSSFDFEHIDDSIDIFTGKEQGHVYSRYGNPTIDVVADKIAQLEVFGTDITAYGLMTSSGMSAISTLLLATLSQGDKILTQGNLYGGTTELLLKVMNRMGIEPIFADLTDIEQVDHILSHDDSIKMIYLETPSNPTLDVVDIQAIVKRAKKHEVKTAIDNTFCTPIIQQPLTLGVDFVIHSTTKYLNGHGNSIAGAIISKDEQQHKSIWQTLKLVGATCNAWDAWLLNNGLKTLALRMEKHSYNAMQLATWLQDQQVVNHVNYNGLSSHQYHDIAAKQMSNFGGMLSFEVDGGIEKAKAVIDGLSFCTQAPTLGDVDTLILHPATSSHLNVDSEMRTANGITDGLIRVSVGIEHVEDIIADFDQSLSSVFG